MLYANPSVKCLIHLGNNDSVEPDPDATKATVEECTRCLVEAEPWPDDNRSQIIEECLFGLDDTVSTVRRRFPMAKLIFIPPLLPLVTEWYDDGETKLKRDRIGTLYYVHRMTELAKKKGCKIISFTGGLELQNGIHLTSKGEQLLEQDIRWAMDSS